MLTFLDRILYHEKTDKKMKVLMIAHDPPYQGGIVQYCILLANALQTQGVAPQVIGFKSLYPPFLYKGKLPKKDMSSIHFEKGSKKILTWYNPLSWLKTASLLKKYDILHIHWVSPLLAPLYFTILQYNKLFTKKKVLMTCHNIEPHESTFLDKLFIRIVFSEINHFIVHAGENKKRLMHQYQIDEKNISIIRHGNFDMFTRWEEKNQGLRKTFNIEGKAILFFGYIRDYKGLQYLLKALPGVLKKENATLIIAGELWEKWDKYRKIIEEEKIKSHLRIYPHYINDKEVYKFFRAAEIVVLPYNNTEQTISGPFLVSMSFGKPTIIAAAGGIKESADGKAMLVTPGNVKELETAIITLLQNQELQKKLSSAALASSKELTWEKVAINYKKAYEITLRP